eukprot:CAMPEP_0172468300 /NCGR_PEP_ID=MMETSP1065-20121228/60952_1 /TAXON_ID=265537 /ORGANISM="Amphiprora paludosa, Strain CCMP125" /LENGTH=137 /DNA_ID=CAMNT_0013225663 /DNA_START=59 /DNA_END=472 /DNA_ORIENTATION=+
MKIIQSIILALAFGMSTVVGKMGGKKGKGGKFDVDGIYETIDPSDGGSFKVVFTGDTVLFFETVTSLCADPLKGSFGGGTVVEFTDVGLTANLQLNCRDGSVTGVPFVLEGVFSGKGTIESILPGNIPVTFFKIGPV